MKKKFINFFGPARRIVLVATAVSMSASMAFAQVQNKISGRVVDDNGEPLPGVAVMVEGTSSGTVTDFDGNYTLTVADGAILKFSYVGFDNQVVTVAAGTKVYDVTMKDDSKELDEVIVVGYGQQKKASVVGAITQTTGEVLERAAGISNVAAALTGNLPGVITTTSTGLPGSEETKIVIRGASSPNSTDPLVLVDGVKRDMASVDMASVDKLSVLKDASATAVYGVEGANGVILITTKRGQEGKPQINVSAEGILKMVSKLPGKYDSYDALMRRNMAIEHELNINPSNWSKVNSQKFIDRYRNQTTVEQKERYPNVDWQEVLFRKHAMSYNANVNISGGTKNIRYFSSADFVHEGDLMKEFDADRGYSTGMQYNRLNFRANLDFLLTPTTTFRANVAGSNGIQKAGAAGVNVGDWQFAQTWAGVYRIAPNIFLPRYSDGSYGYDFEKHSNMTNSVQKVATGGVNKTTSSNITTDFTLDQDLKFVTEGLRFHGLISWDNQFSSSGYQIQESWDTPQTTWIDPYTGRVEHGQKEELYNKFDPSYGQNWRTAGGSLNWVNRSLYYQLQLNYGRQFGDHNVTSMGTFARRENSSGSGTIPSYKEDWVFRVTYDYAGKYFAEYNGAYNGTEKFAKKNRFAFFQSGALGWLITEEPFMASLKESKILDMLKIRASYGQIGDDGGVPRFAYMSEWGYGGKTKMGEKSEESPYEYYYEKSVGNADVHWEVVNKFNVGVDYSFLDGLVAGCVEVFRDKRTDVYLAGGSRSVPDAFGMSASAANLGEVNNKGFEVEVRLNKVLNNGLRLWANMNFTHAENEVTAWEDPELYPAYRKTQGYQIGQVRTFVDKGFLNSYDDIYGSPSLDNYESERIPGDYYLIDFNGDGQITDDDQVPYGYGGTPQNTYNATLGAEYKGWSFFMQWYGTNNATRDVNLGSFGGQVDNVFEAGDWWSEAGNNADVVTPRYTSHTKSTGTQFLYDGSYLRLKNVELAYTFRKLDLGKFTFKNVKLYVGANNLWVWTTMPDDRESNFAGSSNDGAYPTVKRVNFGVKFSL